MSQSIQPFTPVDVGPPVPGTPVDRIGELFSAEQLDGALDRAAKVSRATVAVFAAAPVDCWDEGQGGKGGSQGCMAAIEFVVEFFVPPPSIELFHRELEAQLLQASPLYVAGRYRAEFAHCTLHNIAPGTFHQYRIVTRSTALEQRDGRWSRDRGLLDGLLHQSRTGWREVGVS